jgi:4-amino-4-deoxy-L-arabinose transferase-like glycosyltransferase
MPEAIPVMTDTSEIAPRTFQLGLFAMVLLAALLRGLFPAADPPWTTTVGVVWHDEGAWVHNARNKALFAAWTADAWNPMYIAPVFTALEYLSFEAFGVGVRQARLVPEACGVLSVWLLALGVSTVAGRRSGLIAGGLLATNYVYVMWNRAALMEGPMVAFMVASWYCYARAHARAIWGIGAALCALLAFFTKASAAFFVATLALDAGLTIVLSRFVPPAPEDGLFPQDHASSSLPAAWITIAALAAGGLAAVVLFVIPNWTDYRFYNWQMSVTRKPSYTARALFDRVTWFPVLHDLFTRSWFVLAVGLTSALGMLARWRALLPAERLLLLWLGLGASELILHDVGNERRFVLFLPALVALTAIALGRDRVLLRGVEGIDRRTALLAAPVVLYAAYVVAGALVRVAFLYDVRPNVRFAGSLAVVFTAVLYRTWPRIPRLLAHPPWTAAGAVGVTALVSVGQVVQFGQWAAARSYKNIAASRELGRVLPPGTLVHGKLANGLSLENRIRPIFVGREFGNYQDRMSRDDVRYILTYVAPSLGYESQAANPVIKDVLDAYPNHRIIMTFDVAETSTGHDRAALIDKFGGTDRQELRQMSGRAKD